MWLNEGLTAAVWWVMCVQAVQVWTNYCSGTTGQLSGLAVCLAFAGSLALIFTSLQVWCLNT